MHTLKKLQHSLKAISPVISVLLMIAIAIVASLIAYAWVVGYIEDKTDRAGNSIAVQSYTSQTNLVLYVQNTGMGLVHLKQDASVYVNDVLYNIIRYGPHDDDLPTSGLIPINPGQTVKIITDCLTYKAGDKIKIVTLEGTTIDVSGTKTPTPASSTTTYANVNFYVNPAEAGTLTSGSTNLQTPQSFALGTVIIVNANANGGYVFSSWTFSGNIQINNPTSPSTTIQINGAGTVTANFVSQSSPKLVFTAGTSQNLLIGQVSSIITVQRQTSIGSPATGDTAIVSLSTTSPTGTFYSDAAGTIPISSITINNGESMASFYYKDETADSQTLTVATSGYQSVSTTFTIKNPEPTPAPTPSPSPSPSPTASPTPSPTPTPTSTPTPPSEPTPTPTPTPTPSPTPTPTPTVQVTFSLNPPGAGTISPIGTQTYTVGSLVPIHASANNGYAFSSWTFNGNIAIDETTSPIAVAQINGEGSITANFVSSATNRLAIISGNSQTILVNQVSSPITVERQDSNGESMTGGKTTVNLTSTSPSGKFYSDPAGNTEITTIDITGSASTVDFYYKDSQAGTPTITVSASGYSSESATFTIVDSVSQTATRLSFIDGIDQVFTIKAPSSQITVERQDAIGRPVTSGTTTVTLTATMGAFYSDSACTQPITTITINDGSSMASFYYKSSTTGTATLVASAQDLTSATATITVTDLTPNLFYETFDNSTWTQRWTTTPTNAWQQTSDQSVSAPYSMKSTSSSQNKLTLNGIDVTGAEAITISFDYRVQETKPTNFQLRYFDGAKWVTLRRNLGNPQPVIARNNYGGNPPETWYHYAVTIQGPFSITNLQIQLFSQRLQNNAAVWVDNVKIIVYR